MVPAPAVVAGAGFTEGVGVFCSLEHQGGPSSPWSILLNIEKITV